MLSLGTWFDLAFNIRSRSFALDAGSPPPSLTAIVISLPIFVNTFALCASVFSFLCLMFAHLLCPYIVFTSLFFVFYITLFLSYFIYSNTLFLLYFIYFYTIFLLHFIYFYTLFVYQMQIFFLCFITFFLQFF